MLQRGLMMTEPKRCCENQIQFVIVYTNDKIISVCQKHSKQYEYRRGVKWIFDYVTKKELTPKEVFGNSEDDDTP